LGDWFLDVTPHVLEGHEDHGAWRPAPTKHMVQVMGDDEPFRFPRPSPNVDGAPNVNGRQSKSFRSCSLCTRPSLPFEKGYYVPADSAELRGVFVSADWAQRLARRPSSTPPRHALSRSSQHATRRHDPVPLGGRTLRVIGKRDDEADQPTVLIVEDVSRGIASRNR
jgi:hypothetical protein